MIRIKELISCLTLQISILRKHSSMINSKFRREYYYMDFMQNLRMSEKSIANIDLPTHHIYSDAQFNIIKKYIRDFESSLDEYQEVGMLLTNFGQSVLMQVTQIGYEKSVMMVFRGYVNGNKATLLQHINQLSFLLTAISKDDDKPKRPIGFNIPTE